MVTVNDFLKHEEQVLSYSSGGSIPAGRWSAYSTHQGKLTHIPSAELPRQKLTKNHVLIYGTYGEHPMSEEDVSTLRINGFIFIVRRPDDELFEKLGKPITRQSVAEQSDIKADAVRLSETAAQYEITTAEQYAHGAEIIKALKAMQAEIGKTFDPIVEKAYYAHREAIAQRAKYLDPLKEGEKRVKSAMADWYRQEQVRLIEERRAAEKRAELERAALEAAKAQSLDAAIKAGDLAAAREIRAIDVFDEIKATVPLQTKVAGVSARKTYRAEVVDFAALVKAAADNHQYLAFLSANLKALNSFARAAKTTACVIPGVSFIEDVTMGVRS